MKPERSGLAFVGHAARRVDDIETVWPTGISALRRVMQIVNDGRNVQSQPDHAGVGGCIAFSKSLGAGYKNVVLEVAGHLPAVRGMRLLNVDHVECGAIPIPLIQRVKGGNLPPEGRSGMAAKNQDHRFLVTE